MTVRYLALAEVLLLHEHAICEFGGSPEVMNLGLLDSALQSPRQTMFGQELYPDLFSKAGILFFLLVKNHCFVDGNKRTATLALIEFLERNGFTLKVTNDKLYRFTIDVATSALPKDDVAAWIEAKAAPLKAEGLFND